MKIKTFYRAIWISDVHLGSRGAKAEQLLSFLKTVECDYLYLVGDIFDFLALRRRIFWDDSATALIRKILKMVRHGTKVYYLPGNHDDAIRSLTPFFLGEQIEVCDEIEHTTERGEKFLVLHGDQFDFIAGHMHWLTVVGTVLYDWLLTMNGFVHRIRMRIGMRKYWSLSAYLKAKTKKAISFMHDFEVAALKTAKAKQCDGVICGHIHTAKIYQKDGMTYVNCGDWVESLSAVVEKAGGLLEIIYWHDMDEAIAA